MAFPIETVPWERCRSCGSDGEIFARNVRDRVYAVPGEWNLRRCANAACGAVWLDPCPIPADIPKLYETYFTHGDPAAKGLLARFSEWFYRVTQAELLARCSSTPKGSQPLAGGRSAAHTPGSGIDDQSSTLEGSQHVGQSCCDPSGVEKNLNVRDPGVFAALDPRLMATTPSGSKGRRNGLVTAVEKVFARCFLAITPIRENVIAQTRWLHPLPPGDLFDIGCGSGEFLAAMRGLGWNGAGLEPDDRAAEEARKKGFAVTTGAIEALEAGAQRYDAVTLVHVVEHLLDAQAVLRKCRELLKPGGTLLIVTPNVESLAAQRFGASWFGWEIPRHLHMFTPRALMNELTKAGFTTARVHTSSHVASGMWRLSRHIREHGTVPHMNAGFAPWLWFPSGWFQVQEYLKCRHAPVGEELIAFASV